MLPRSWRAGLGDAVSIVEKVVKQQRAQGRQPAERGQTDGERQKRPQERKVGHTVAASEARKSEGIVVTTRNLDHRGLVTISENPLLAQDFRFLKRPLLSRLFRPDAPADASDHVIVITSDLPGAGKTFVSLNLAEAIAREQLIKVILIDADSLRRSLTTALGQEDRPGLLESLSDMGSRPQDYLLSTDMPSLSFLPAGQPRDDATELLAGKRLQAVFDELKDPDTVIILDSPPLLLTAEARVLVEQATHSLIIVEAGRTTVSEVAAVFKLIGDTARNVSLILNKAPHANDGHEAGYYGYGYGYGNGNGSGG